MSNLPLFETKKDEQIKQLEARVKELESGISNLLELLVDELGLSFVMSNIKSIDDACALLPENHEFKKSVSDE